MGFRDSQSSCRGLLLFWASHSITSWLPSGPGQTYMETAHEKITVFSEFISTKLLPGYHLFCCVLWLEAKPKILSQAQHQWGVQVGFCPLLGEAAGFVLMCFCFCWQNTFLSFREELLIITTKRHHQTENKKRSREGKPRRSLTLTRRNRLQAG